MIHREGTQAGARPMTDRRSSAVHKKKKKKKGDGTHHRFAVRIWSTMMDPPAQGQRPQSPQRRRPEHSGQSSSAKMSGQQGAECVLCAFVWIYFSSSEGMR